MKNIAGLAGAVAAIALSTGVFAGPVVVAHRGAADLTMPESSLPAYSNAVASGSEIVKLDIQRTRDGVAVLCHDSNLKRLMGWNVEIGDLDYAELRSNGVYLAKGGCSSERIVRLDEALRVVRGVPEFWIDFKKHYDPAFADAVLDEFRKAGIDTGRVMLATFNRAALKGMLKWHPEIRRIAHIGAAKLDSGEWTFSVGGEAAPRGEEMPRLLELCRSLRLFGVNMPVGQFSTRPDDVKVLKRNGLWVSLWFVQNAETAAKYRGCGADAFVSDHASQVRGVAGRVVHPAEPHYAFRAELERVHERGLRDASLRPAADEFEIADGAEIALPADCGEVLENAGRDFAEYLLVSMGVSARVSARGAKGAVTVALDKSVGERTSRIETGDGGIMITSGDGRTAAQALYHLEDVTGLRRAPYVAKGVETRRMRFSPRMVHSGWGMDLVPENYMRRMAHYGYDALLVYVKKVGKTKSCAAFEDVNAIIRRAAAHGIDVYLYTSVKAYVHPSDPGAQKVFDDTYGEIARAYPEAKGLILVGESCNFPSRDERACSDPYEVKKARGDKRPAPGWFPCRDYPDWLNCVKRAIARHAPEMKVVFWTYNWSKDWTPETPAARMELIDMLPTDRTVLLSTFEMPERFKLGNGLETAVSDYTVACPGPGANFSKEAARAKERGLELFTMCNTGGHTWDFGTAPYEPYPFLWAKRWSALAKANGEWGLSGLMESHHYGWYPNFVSELAKEAYVDGGLPLERHARLIAARDFGEGNADAAVAVWRDWSEKGAQHPPTLGNQYGPFRIGPAYPFEFGRHIDSKDFPCPPHAAYGIDICHLNFTEELWGQRMYYPDLVPQELELLRPLAKSFMDGAGRFRAMAAGLSGRQAKKASGMAVLGEYLGRCVTTAINVKRGALAWEAGDTNALRAVAREEYANAKAALPLVDADSRLGFECSMEYCGGREQIEWKLARMEALYGRLCQ